MGSERKALWILILLSVFMTLSNAAGNIVVYWGQNANDGSLRDTCDTGNYRTVIIGFLNVFGGGRTPQLTLSPGHCDYFGRCDDLEFDIEYCQSVRNVRVFLSIGGPDGDYSIANANDANQVSQYLFYNFLYGQTGPLGKVTLDGIDFAIEAPAGGSNAHWDDLVMALNTYRQNGYNFLLSAAPHCVYPDPYLSAAINTQIFDYKFIKFYDTTSCQYSDSDPSKFYKAWDNWAMHEQISNLYLGLPASPDAATGGYIPPNTLKDRVLPYVKQAFTYGGVMLWDRGYDAQSHYSDQIKPALLNQLQSVTNASKQDY